MFPVPLFMPHGFFIFRNRRALESFLARFDMKKQHKCKIVFGEAPNPRSRGKTGATPNGEALISNLPRPTLRSEQGAKAVESTKAFVTRAATLGTGLFLRPGQ